MKIHETEIPRRDVLKVLGSLPLAAFVPVLARANILDPLYFSCNGDNDLYSVAKASGIPCSRYDHAKEAVSRAPQGSGLLILAGSYPKEATQVDAKVYQEAAGKRLRLYVEFPSSLPDLNVGRPRRVAYGYYHNVLDRAVVDTNALGPELKRLQILALHGCSYVPVESKVADLVLARVAGFNTAVYGIPQQGVHPILFKHPSRDILVGATKLSDFIEGRYGPAACWPYVWKWVFEWLSPRQQFALLYWTPAVHPAFGRRQRLPVSAELGAFRKGVAWFSNAKLFVAPSWKQKAYHNAKTPGQHPNPAPSWSVGDGSDGLLEGFSSEIEWDGMQPVGWNLRNDCAGEVSMTMAFSGVVGKKPADSKISANLNDFIYFKSELAQGPRNDPRSPSFGLVGWSVPNSADVYFGDDNARSMLGTMAASGLLRSNRWNEKVLRCLLANLRTTGVLGFRPNALTEKELQKNGWRYYYEQRIVNCHPHFEAYPWACYLRAYEMTHYAPFLDRTRTGIRMTMAAYPNNWRWTNGLQQERARMLLPLAWLVRVKDTPEHRQWLKRIASDLISFQTESGAIREELGTRGKSSIPPPKTNAEYGTSETSLLQKNGDPACDLLYTVNFAFLGLHEAAAATHGASYIRAENKLAEFLCRIQIQSEKHPELAGGWFRAFDYKDWDYWASASDWGWGPWSVEAGWTMSWITSVLAMRNLHTSLWDVTGRCNLGAPLNHLMSIMFS